MSFTYLHLRELDLGHKLFNFGGVALNPVESITEGTYKRVDVPWDALLVSGK